jgi:predicted alternative tryptophan synthase beta-subunit
MPASRKILTAVHDAFYDDAKHLVTEAGTAATSSSTSRAAHLIDVLEERGVIGPGDGQSHKL